MALNGRTAPSHPSPSALAHCVVRTTPANFRSVVDFYIKLLSAHIVFEAENMAFLRYDDEHHRIAVAAHPGTSPKSRDSIRAEFDHIAFTYPTLTALAQTYVSLKSSEPPVLPIWSVNHGMTSSMYYRDPDGNKVELQVDNFSTAEEADAFMSGPLFAQNPIGTDIEPNEWSSVILAKMKPDGTEGLGEEEVKEIKTRVEIGSRLDLPEIMT